MPVVGEGNGADRASNDADVSIASPKIPYGGFSPVRLQGRTLRQGLPSSLVCHCPSCSLLSPCVPCSVSGTMCLRALPCKRSSALPQGPSLQTGLCCHGLSSLNRPHPPTHGHILISPTCGLYLMP